MVADDFDVIADFGEVMEKLHWSQAFFDTSLLPHPKNLIKDALIRKHNEMDDEEYKGLLRTGLLAIVQFQDNIGSTPIMGTVDILGLKYTDADKIAKYIQEEESKLDKLLFDSLRVIAEREYQLYKSKLN